MRNLIVTTYLLITGLTAFPSEASIRLSASECLAVYGAAAYNIAAQRDNKISKDTFLKQYNTYLSGLNIPATDVAILEAVDIMKDLVDYVYLSPKTKEELFDEKSTQCLSSKGVLRRNEVL